MDPKILRRLVLVVFVGGIAGMIVGSILDSNGVAVTFGLVTAVAAICLMLVTSVTSRTEWIAFDEERAESMEARIQELLTAGADEQQLRDLVRDAVLLGRSARRVAGAEGSAPHQDHAAGPGEVRGDGPRSQHPRHRD
ncbi:MAG: hypothetical protein JST64_09625 [Actinobacteria bacterium]|nr:hypothetical protein [Actinomycetota bacterium]